MGYTDTEKAVREILSGLRLSRYQFILARKELFIPDKVRMIAALKPLQDW